jgi:hypothetical protein
MLTKSKSVKTGYQIQLRFQLTQHIRDEQLMTSLINYLDCGNVYKNREAIDFQVTKLSDLINKVIPIFEKNPIQGEKFVDYLYFIKVVELMKNKIHLTEEGLNQIRNIKVNMNTGRSNMKK